MRYLYEALFVASVAFLFWVISDMDHFDLEPRAEPIVYAKGGR
jgi:hypothetical protein